MTAPSPHPSLGKALRHNYQIEMTHTMLLVPTMGEILLWRLGSNSDKQTAWVFLTLRSYVTFRRMALGAK